MHRFLPALPSLVKFGGWHLVPFPASRKVYSSGLTPPQAPAVAIAPGAICPNCGGTEFDTDGDCTSCWEPGVVKPDAGSGSTEGNDAPPAQPPCLSR